MDLNTEELCREAIREKMLEYNKLLKTEPENLAQALILSGQIVELEREIDGLKRALAKFGG